MKFMIHIPVMVEEVMKYLGVKEGGTYIDGTAGAGGHLQKIIESVGEKGMVIAIDQNKAAVEYLVSKYQGAQVVKIIRGNYKFIEKIVKENLPFIPSFVRREQEEMSSPYEGEEKGGVVDGVLLDLGFSSDEIQEEGRGFSFYDTESLDMRYGQGEEGEYLEPGMTAEEVVNTYPESDLADIFWRYGDETKSRFYAKKIAEYRRKQRITSAAELAYIIGNARPTPEAYRVLSERTHAHRASPGGTRRDIGLPRGIIHPATKSFMALRIVVNREFENIELGLTGVMSVLKSNGRCVVLTFHSGEDRIVKQFVKNHSREGVIRDLTKHVVKPSREEVVRNRLARSAKLRAFEKV